MAGSVRTGRYVRVGFAALLLVSAAQATYWIIDQRWYTSEVEASRRLLYAQQERAAERLLAGGVAEEEVRVLFPDLRIGDGAVEIAAGIEADLAEERRSRLNRYVWEGGFFLAVLLASVGVIAQALRHDAALRRRQQNFLASVSHELRSPLATARIAAETLEMRDPPRERRTRQVQRVLRGLDRLDTMITNLLETVRIEEGRLVLDVADYDLGDVLAPVLAGCQDRADDLGVSIERDIPAGLAVHADAEALRVVLRNLLDNALEAVSETDSPRVRVAAYASGRSVVLEVVDNGRGFEADEAERLFEKFYRPGDEMRRGGKGAGLGLHIVRELVSRCGGKVEATSRGPQMGAVLRSRWPRAREAAR